MTKQNSCTHCEDKGYTEIRDCSGKVQRSETCSFCHGSGYIKPQEMQSEEYCQLTNG